MKIQCNVCEAAEAMVLCCADEAALCLACDEKVHAANKLASKHHRVALTASSASQVPLCDICQESAGYFFCLEDRALLCQECDTSIHSMNAHVSAHRRFLLTGVRVETESTRSTRTDREPTPMISEESKEEPPGQVSWTGVHGDGEAPLTGNLMNMGVDWQFDEFCGQGVDHNHGFSVNQSSKGGSGKLGVDRVSRASDFQWRVPEIPSPPAGLGFQQGSTWR
ncbi:uncharacterized protein LOC144701334 [Wolffia australiana]